MAHLTRNDYCGALALLAVLEPAAADVPGFLNALPRALQSFVAFESVVLGSCDLPGGATGELPGCCAAIALGDDGNAPVRLLLRRRATAFSARDRERLLLVQPHLAFLYVQARSRGGDVTPIRVALPPAMRPGCPGLTPRESDVMHWLAFGKTDADIAAFLSISTRTVHKHLEHIYEKLGVETRTAAVMAVRRAP